MEASEEFVSDWEQIKPAISSESEFREIASDFGDPLEIVREAISNSFDAGATTVRILFDVQDIDGSPTLVIEFEDNGRGMSKDVITRAFWGLGISTSRPDPEKIGEKGHGTKIYLRSESVEVRTQTADEAWESVCDRPMRDLANQRMHAPKLRSIEKWRDGSGTFIKVVGYNSNERSKFSHEVVRDYINWFTKFGSVEQLANLHEKGGFTIDLKCLGDKDYQIHKFGHIFPEENSDINKMFQEYGTGAGDLFVKRYLYLDQRLDSFPEVSYDVIISVEGDQAKRKYNPLIRDRRREKTGTYKVADRYGLWLCKDYIAVERVNSWITGFGSGSNSYTLLHAFVNCQSLKLTANRGSIANTSPLILEALQNAVQVRLDEIDDDLGKRGIYTLFEWEREQRTLTQEKSDYTARRKALAGRKHAQLEGRTLWEPKNESELFGLFMMIYALRPDIFDFEPMDYNTSRGIDMLGRNKTDNTITEAEFWYIELKYILRGNLNHGFKYLRYILCWEFDVNVTKSTEFGALSEPEPRFLETHENASGDKLYFLNSRSSATKIQILRLRELLNSKLNLTFTD